MNISIGSSSSSSSFDSAQRSPSREFYHLSPQEQQAHGIDRRSPSDTSYGDVYKYRAMQLPTQPAHLVSISSLNSASDRVLALAKAALLDRVQVSPSDDEGVLFTGTAGKAAEEEEAEGAIGAAASSRESISPRFTPSNSAAFNPSTTSSLVPPPPLPPLPQPDTTSFGGSTTPKVPWRGGEKDTSQRDAENIEEDAGSEEALTCDRALRYATSTYQDELHTPPRSTRPTDKGSETEGQPPTLQAFARTLNPSPLPQLESARGTGGGVTSVLIAFDQVANRDVADTAEPRASASHESEADATRPQRFSRGGDAECIGHSGEPTTNTHPAPSTASHAVAHTGADLAAPPRFVRPLPGPAAPYTAATSSSGRLPSRSADSAAAASVSMPRAGEPRASLDRAGEYAATLSEEREQQEQHRHRGRSGENGVGQSHPDRSASRSLSFGDPRREHRPPSHAPALYRSSSVSSLSEMSMPHGSRASPEALSRRHSRSRGSSGDTNAAERNGTVGLGEREVLHQEQEAKHPHSLSSASSRSPASVSPASEASAAVQQYLAPPKSEYGHGGADMASTRKNVMEDEVEDEVSSIPSTGPADTARISSTANATAANALRTHQAEDESPPPLPPAPWREKLVAADASSFHAGQSDAGWSERQAGAKTAHPRLPARSKKGSQSSEATANAPSPTSSGTRKDRSPQPAAPAQQQHGGLEGGMSALERWRAKTAAGHSKGTTATATTPATTEFASGTPPRPGRLTVPGLSSLGPPHQNIGRGTKHSSTMTTAALPNGAAQHVTDKALSPAAAKTTPDTIKGSIDSVRWIPTSGARGADLSNASATLPRTSSRWHDSHSVADVEGSVSTGTADGVFFSTSHVSHAQQSPPPCVAAVPRVATPHRRSDRNTLTSAASAEVAHRRGASSPSTSTRQRVRLTTITCARLARQDSLLGREGTMTPMRISPHGTGPSSRPLSRLDAVVTDPRYLVPADKWSQQASGQFLLSSSSAAQRALEPAMPTAAQHVLMTTTYQDDDHYRDIDFALQSSSMHAEALTLQQVSPPLPRQQQQQQQHQQQHRTLERNGRVVRTTADTVLSLGPESRTRPGLSSVLTRRSAHGSTSTGASDEIQEETTPPFVRAWKPLSAALYSSPSPRQQHRATNTVSGDENDATLALSIDAFLRASSPPVSTNSLTPADMRDGVSDAAEALAAHATHERLQQNDDQYFRRWPHFTSTTNAVPGYTALYSPRTLATGVLEARETLRLGRPTAAPPPPSSSIAAAPLPFPQDSPAITTSASVPKHAFNATPAFNYMTAAPSSTSVRVNSAASVTTQGRGVAWGVDGAGSRAMPAVGAAVAAATSISKRIHPLPPPPPPTVRVNLTHPPSLSAAPVTSSAVAAPDSYDDTAAAAASVFPNEDWTAAQHEAEPWSLLRSSDSPVNDEPNGWSARHRSPLNESAQQVARRIPFVADRSLQHHHRSADATPLRAGVTRNRQAVQAPQLLQHSSMARVSLEGPFRDGERPARPAHDRDGYTSSRTHRDRHLAGGHNGRHAVSTSMSDDGRSRLEHIQRSSRDTASAVTLVSSSSATAWPGPPSTWDMSMASASSHRRLPSPDGYAKKVSARHAAATLTDSNVAAQLRATARRNLHQSHLVEQQRLLQEETFRRRQVQMREDHTFTMWVTELNYQRAVDYVRCVEAASHGDVVRSTQQSMMTGTASESGSVAPLRLSAVREDQRAMAASLSVFSKKLDTMSL